MPPHDRSQRGHILRFSMLSRGEEATPSESVRAIHNYHESISSFITPHQESPLDNGVCTPVTHKLLLHLIRARMAEEGYSLDWADDEWIIKAAVSLSQMRQAA